MSVLDRFRLKAGDFELVAEPVAKHGTHDQKTHGSWANTLVGNQTLLGTTVTSIIDKLSEKDTPGFSIDIRTKTSPKDGFIASDSGAERSLDWAKASSSRENLRNEIVNYVLDHAELLDGAGAFFGGWVDKGVLYFDVSRRYASRSEGVRAGFQNKQKAIYDVVEDSYIYMEDEVDERTNKARSGGSSQTSQGNDPTGSGSPRRRDGGSPTGQRVNPPHVCLGRYQGVEKHLEGQHDQATHGSWASGRYGPDSVKSARDGAKEYAFKVGIKQDDSIDYQTTVANRARAARIADAYDQLPVDDKKAYESYTALATEVEAQFDYMTKTMGIKVEFVDEDPYKTSREMFADVSKGTLKVLRTASTGSHPFFTDDQNDKFRAVHDFFGHAATGRGFGQDGEESAWVHHSQMFKETARAALTTETRGQNSWYNTRGKGFAEQKVALLPKEFWEVPKTFEKSYKVIRFAPGLIPVFKHQEHDQSTHGNWARGISAEDEQLINEMENLGPSKEDILNAITGGEAPDYLDLIDYVNNDSEQYGLATEGIDERVAEAIAEYFAENPESADLTEQEKANIYEDVQTKMILDHVNADDGSIAAAWQAENGGSYDPDDLQGYFDDVYGMSHEVTDDAGNVATVLSSQTTSVYQDGESLVVSGQIVDSDGNYAGEFQRTFYIDRNENGEDVLVVEHDLFKMEEEYRGSGFGTKFLARQEAYYVSKGIDAINVGTAWDGARHWARAGFDFNPKYVDKSISDIAIRVLENPSAYGADTEAGKEFDALMSRATNGYTRDSNGEPTWESLKSMKDDNFPTPNDFAMIGYANRVKVGTNEYGKPIYGWDGKDILDGLFLKYTKGLTQEGRTLNQGPIDRDGDGLVYDGTAREKPASAVNSTP